MGDITIKTTLVNRNMQQIDLITKLQERESKLIEVIKMQRDSIEDMYGLADNIEHYYLVECIPTKDEVDQAEAAKKRAYAIEEKLKELGVEL